MKPSNIVVAGALALLAVVGCDAAPQGMGCDLDTDCPVGRYCAAGGCAADCRLDRDCLAVGGTCDVRGRCTGAPHDGGVMDGGARDTGTCHAASDCDDGVFCNGAERCAPSDPGANARGCAAATGPQCLASQTCNEMTDHCDSNCDTAADADGDGDRSTDCGGGDCDDANAGRSSRLHEQCDALNIDEDCDPCTVGSPPTSGTMGGDSDSDGDGYFNTHCCNRIPTAGPAPTCTDRIDHLTISATLVCGTDCDDTRSGVFPTATEACDGQDNDCNGQTDELGRVDWWPDADADGRGDAHATPLSTCMTPTRSVTNNFDCNDSDANIYGATPTAAGAAERCNGQDDNCDGTADEGDPQSGAACQPIAGRPGAHCAGTMHCMSGALACVQTDTSYPRAEVCPGNDDEDCDGANDAPPQGCMNECGAGYLSGNQTCNGGTWSRCSATSADRDCANPCGPSYPHGRELCTGGVWAGTCSVNTATANCSGSQCGQGTYSCTGGIWESTCHNVIGGPYTCPLCDSAWPGQQICNTNGTIGPCGSPPGTATTRNDSPASGLYGHDTGYAVAGGAWYVPAGTATSNVIYIARTLPAGDYQWFLNGTAYSNGGYGVWVSFDAVSPGMGSTRLVTSWSMSGSFTIDSFNDCTTNLPYAIRYYSNPPWTSWMQINSASLVRTGP